MDKIKKLLKDIKDLKVQGATNVAKATLDLMELQTKKSKAKTISAYKKELQDIANQVLKVRPTEPMAIPSTRH